MAVMAGRVGHRDDGGCNFPKGPGGLNGKFNGATLCNHKSQRGGKMR